MKPAGGVITVLVGTVLLRLTFTGTYTRYVRVGMGPWLVVTGVVVIGLGCTTLVRAWRSGGGSDDGDHEHGDGRVGWLLLAPIAALLLVAPPALGSYGVERGARLDIRSGASELEPLPTDGRPVPLTLLDFNQRAFDDDGASLDGATVQLTGFVAGGPTGGNGNRNGDDPAFRLARYQIACCAADAAPVVVDVVGIRGQPPTRDQWVTVTGSFRPGGDDVPRLAATSVVEISAPDDPYE